jgi:2-octaprenyl-6-methoxyphenol hydroxylase
MAQKKHHQSDIIISGGGTPGLCLGILLARAGLEVAIIDAAPPAPLKKTADSGRTTALMQSSLNILKAAGFDAPEKFGGKISTMRIIDDSLQGREAQASIFESSSIGLPAFGYNIPASTLRAFLYERAAQQKNITLYCPQKLYDFSIENDSAIARLEDGSLLKSPLIIGADGRKSIVRGLAGIQTREISYGQSALTFIVTHTKSHNHIATEFHRPNGPLALVPLAGDRSSVVWVEKTSRAEELLHLKKQDFTRIFEDQTDGILGKIDLETGPENWPLQSIVANALTAPHVILMAEAAHVMSPITAQGLNLSLRDVAALAEIITDAARAGIALSDSTLLKAYEKRRRLDIESRVAGVDGMMRLVSTHNPALKTMRRSGFKMLDMLAPLKIFATHQGLAPPVDEGRLARGQAL